MLQLLSLDLLENIFGWLLVLIVIAAAFEMAAHADGKFRLYAVANFVVYLGLATIIIIAALIMYIHIVSNIP